MSLENNLKEKENKIVEIKENEIIKNENISTDIIENKKTLSTLSIFGILLSIFIIILLKIYILQQCLYQKINLNARLKIC